MGTETETEVAKRANSECLSAQVERIRLAGLGRDGWSEEEDRLLLQGHTLLGNKSNEIARMVGTGRTGDSVRSRHSRLVSWHEEAMRGGVQPVPTPPPHGATPAPSSFITVTPSRAPTLSPTPAPSPAGAPPPSPIPPVSVTAAKIVQFALEAGEGSGAGSGEASGLGAAQAIGVGGQAGCLGGPSGVLGGPAGDLGGLGGQAALPLPPPSRSPGPQARPKA